MRLLFLTKEDRRLVDIFLPVLIKWNVICVAIVAAGYLPVGG